MIQQYLIKKNKQHRDHVAALLTSFLGSKGLTVERTAEETLRMSGVFDMLMVPGKSSAGPQKFKYSSTGHGEYSI